MALPSPAKAGIRDLIVAIAPPWLQGPTAGGPPGGVGERLLYCFGLGQDGLIEKIDEGMLAHLPPFGDPSALPLLGVDWQIPQGVSEPNNIYALRLQGAPSSWQRAGNAWSVLSALVSSLYPNSVYAACVTDSDSWDVFAAGASVSTPPTHTQPNNPKVWDWDALSAPYQGTTAVGTSIAWWRTWVILCAPGLWSRAPVSGAAGLVSGQCPSSCGWSGTQAQAQAIVSLVTQLKGAGAWVPFVIISFDTTWFQPTSGTSKLPDGHYGRTEKASTASGTYLSGTYAGTYYYGGTYSGVSTYVTARTNTAAYMPGVT